MSANAESHDLDALVRTAMAELHEGVCITDGGDRIVWCNPALERIVGGNAGTVTGRLMSELFAGEEGASVLAACDEVKRSGAVGEFEATITVESRAVCITGRCRPRNPADHREGLICIIDDRTAQRTIERELAEARHYNHQISENAPIGIYLYDCNEQRIIYGNKVYLDCLGYTLEEIQAHGYGIVELIYHPDDYERLIEHDRKIMASRDGEVLHFECRITPKGGGVRWTVAREVVLKRNPDGSAAQIVCAFIDVTEQRETEEALRKTQRLDSLGKLAAGIAHDFNNLLGGIYGSAYLACEKSTEPAVRDDLALALSTIERARNLTGRLLTFAKGGAPVRRVGRLFPLVHETATFALAGSNIACRCTVPPDLWPCDFDTHQIGQVIENLVINARQAMPVGGTVRIWARNRSVKDHAVLAPGDYVCVSVSDTGAGIPPDLHECIFDPFFTTKADGHGLGLSACHSILKRHGGSIEVCSREGEGATFDVYLPAVPGARVPADTPYSVEHRGSGTVLVVDDERVMREVMKDMLALLGYGVVCKDDGRKALDFFVADRKANKRVVAVMLDLTVRTGMGGVETVKKLRKLDRCIPVFTVSGYADHAVMASPAAYGFTASIRKPFKMTELRELFARHVVAARERDDEEDGNRSRR